MAEQHKRGDSLEYLGTIPVEDFPDGFFVGWVPSAQIRTAQYYNLIDDLTVTWVDPVTTRSFIVSKINTTAWPVGAALLDIQFVRTSDGFTRSTETIQINIQHDITYPDPVV